MRKKKLSVILALTLVLCSTSSVLATTNTAVSGDTLSKVTESYNNSNSKAEKMEVLPLQDLKTLKIDPMNQYAERLNGFYEQTIDMPDKSKRTFKFYIPAGTVVCASTVYIVPPNGADSTTFLSESGWKALADKEKFNLVLLESLDGKWQGQGADNGYINSVLSAVGTRTYFNSFGSAYYLIGYGEGADVAQYTTMAMGNKFAGVATFGGNGVDESYIQKMKSTESGEKGVNLSEVPVPMWIVANNKSSGISKAIEYWKNANNCSSSTYSNADANEIYLPNALKINELNSENVSKVMVTIKDGSFYNSDFLSKVWNEFLSNVRRYPGYSNGALRAFDKPEELGIFKQELVVDGLKREWYEYIPKSVREGKVTKAPLVVAMHGAGGSGYEFGGRSGWYKLAEERGFIVVFPTGIMKNDTRWDITGDVDINFLDAMIKKLKGIYSIDEGRVYCTGQSMGSMMSTYLAIKRPDLFTASASTSGLLNAFELKDPNTKYEIPYMVMMGDKDKYLKVGGADIEKDPTMQKQVQFFIDRYKTNSIADAEKYTDGNFVNHIFKNSANVPMIRYVEVKGKTHAVLPEETLMLYDFMCQYYRDADGKVVYMGKTAN